MEHHHNVSSLVNDLVEMATATKRLPELERELQEAKRIIERDGATIARLELKLQDRAVEIDDLRAKLRSVEAERDDAGFRQLEAEDRAGNAVAALTSMQATVVETLAQLKGDGRDQMVRMTKSERDEWNAYLNAKIEAARKEAERPVEPTPEPITAPATVAVLSQDSVSSLPDAAITTEGQREPDPTGDSSPWQGLPNVSPQPSVSSSTASSSGVSVQHDPIPQPAPTIESESGVSVPKDPTASEAGIEQASVITPSADGTGTAYSGKYSGKRYADWPYYVEESSWVANGGTHESYWEDREQFRKPNVA
jgi:hypothetical protein